jgi:signal transduction histidine kinase/CheY-like chemotaxis protein
MDHHYTFSINPLEDASQINKEKRRLQEILDYNLSDFDIQDSGLQMITNLAAIICGTKLGFVTLVGSEYIEILSRVGCEWTCLPRKNSFCNLIISQADFFEVEDALIDERTNKFLVVHPPTSIRFCAGYPIKNSNGYNLGSLVVEDYVPHKMNDFQKLALKTLTEQALVHLELRKQNYKLKLALEQAEKLSKAKDDFLSNMSHELRTPLNATMGFVDFLSKTKLETDQREAIEIIQSSCDLLLTLINDILDISKLESGKIILNFSPFELKSSIEEVHVLLNQKAKENLNSFSMKYDSRIPKLLIGDSVRLKQILINLISNSIKFTKNGKIKTKIKLLEETEYNVKLKFSVKDTGIGIPAEKLQEIFERFVQADKQTSIKYGGTGLGLSISKNLVELFQGKLKVKSKVGIGSTFYFEITLDKFRHEEKNLNSTEVEDFSEIENCRILICEDNMVNIFLLKKIFNNLSIQTEYAYNAKIAIEILKENKNFDLILMDINMPEINGIETTKIIRKDLNLKMPIIGFTANNSQSEREKCIECGMNDYITKTFLADQLINIIMNSIHNKKPYSRKKFKSFNNFDYKNDEIYNNYKTRDTTSTTKDDQNLRKGSLQTNADYTSNSNSISISSTATEYSSNLVFSSDLHQSSDQSMEDEAIFESKYLKEYTGNDVEFEKDFLNLFLDDFSKHIESLLQAISIIDYDQINFIIHKMKSPAMILNLKSIIKIISRFKHFTNLCADKKIFIDEYDNIFREFKKLKNIIWKYIEEKKTTN